MTEAPVSAGTVGRNVARNVERLRKRRGLTFVALTELLGEAGNPIPRLGLQRIETCERRVDVDDLAALASVLGLANPWDLTGEVCETCLNAPPAGFRCIACERPGEVDPVPPRRRRIVTDDLLREVAKVYRAAYAASEPPTAAVAKHFQTSHSTATRWVTMARKSGALGPAQGTKPGEATPATDGEPR